MVPESRPHFAALNNGEISFPTELANGFNATPLTREREEPRRQVAKRWRGIIPKGLRHSAQRCRDEVGATLGGKSQIKINPEGVASNRGEMVIQPRWG